MNEIVKINPDAQISAHRDTFILDRPFVLTQDKTLITGMPYMYSEGNRTAAVRLQKLWVEDNIIVDVDDIKKMIETLIYI